MNKPNILLVVLDAVRAKNTSIHGYHRPTTPFLEEYSQNATFYRQTRSPSIHSVASHASMWTGMHVEEHGVTQHEDTIPPVNTIWQELIDNGYETGLFTRNAVVSRASNLSEPFNYEMTGIDRNTKSKLYTDAYSPTDIKTHEGFSKNLERILQDDSSVRAFLNSVYHIYQKQRSVTSPSLSSKKLVNGFLNWQSNHDQWAACINLIDAHSPYEPSDNIWGDSSLAEMQSNISTTMSEAFIRDQPWWRLEAFEHLYDGAIRKVDYYVQQLVQGLKKEGVHDDTLVIITSDHGDGFGEVSRLNNRTRMIEHSWGIHEVLTHVPLVVKYPGQEDRKVVNKCASLTNLPRTIQSTLANEVSTDSFVSDGPVISSTYRLLKEDVDIFKGSDSSAEDYIGPWRACYENGEEGTVRKYAQHKEESATVEIYNAQDSRLLNREGNNKVRSVFDKLELQDIKGSQQEVTEELEQRLTDLGYLR